MPLAGVAFAALAFCASCRSPEPLKGRPEPSARTFTSAAVEAAIEETSKRIKDPRLREMFEATYPNTLDTTVKGDGYIITGDIDAMWLRDSAAQVWPYLKHLKDDPGLASLVRGIILKQFAAIRLDPYANAFYMDESKDSEWESDLTDMRPGVHERKWEVDSLCYPLRLAYGYWETTGDGSIFGKEWEDTLRKIVAAFREQQRRDGLKTSYKFQRNTLHPLDSLENYGYGPPARPVGLVASAFRPSDDAVKLPFNVPSNFFAADVLAKAGEICRAEGCDEELAAECESLSYEISAALREYAIVKTKKWGKVYAYEVDGFGGAILMDDANAPSLLSLPYLCGVDRNDPVYVNTRKMILSPDGNPYFFKGKAISGIGSPHTGYGKVWPMSLIMRILTSVDDKEKLSALKMLADTTGGTLFMHEGIDADDPSVFTRPWFAWANTLFGEAVMEMARQGLLE